MKSGSNIMKKRIRLKITFLTLLVLLWGMTHARSHSHPEKIQKKNKKVLKKDLRHGKASWYSQRSPGIRRRTANNEIFNDRLMTCAMWGVPFGQKIKVTNKDNGKSVIVRVNDRGPHKRYVRRGRIIDLSKNAFRKIAPLKKGLINIELELL